jgi:hypothetical protein
MYTVSSPRPYLATNTAGVVPIAPCKRPGCDGFCWSGSALFFPRLDQEAEQALALQIVQQPRASRPFQQARPTRSTLAAYRSLPGPANHAKTAKPSQVPSDSDEQWCMASLQRRKSAGGRRPFVRGQAGGHGALEESLCLHVQGGGPERKETQRPPPHRYAF